MPVFIAGDAACASSLPSELPVLGVKPTTAGGGVDGWQYPEGGHTYTISFDIRPSILYSILILTHTLYYY